MAVWTPPRTWIQGERGIPSSVINAQIPDNLQYIFDTFTNIKGVYHNVGDYTIPSGATFTELSTIPIDTRVEALRLTIVGIFPARSQLEYHIDTNPDLIILDFTQDIGDETHFVGKQWIIPSLLSGRHELHVLAKGDGIIRSLQIDLREWT